MTTGTVTQELLRTAETGLPTASGRKSTVHHPVQYPLIGHAEPGTTTLPAHPQTTTVRPATRVVRQARTTPARTPSRRHTARQAVVLIALVWAGPLAITAAWATVAGTVYAFVQYPGLLVITVCLATLAWYSTEGEKQEC